MGKYRGRAIFYKREQRFSENDDLDLNTEAQRYRERYYVVEKIESGFGSLCGAVASSAFLLYDYKNSVTPCLCVQIQITKEKLPACGEL